jgi:hypothetical protein
MLTVLTGTHKTKCMICGGEDHLLMQYDGRAMVDLCTICAHTGIYIADRNTMIFMVKYISDCKRMDPGCRDGSEFNNSCIDKFEETVWLGFLRDYIKKHRRFV